MVAAVLTDLERHASYSAHRFHRLVKLLVFRVCNTQSLFLVRFFADVPFYPCMAARVGNQAFIMVILDLTVSNIAEIGFSAAYNVFHRWQLRRANTGASGDKVSAAVSVEGQAKTATMPANATSLRQNQARLGGGFEVKIEQRGWECNGGGEGGYGKGDPASSNDCDAEGGVEAETGNAASEIELTDDYLELLYRQYVMLACLGAFPLVTVAPSEFPICPSSAVPLSGDLHQHSMRCTGSFCQQKSLWVERNFPSIYCLDRKQRLLSTCSTAKWSLLLLERWGTVQLPDDEHTD